MNHALQNKDGGWGLHIEGTSTMFGTALTYVILRLLGEGSDGGFGAMEKGRNWILDHGSATAITSWGKMWLSVSDAFLFFPCFSLLIDKNLKAMDCIIGLVIPQQKSAYVGQSHHTRNHAPLH